MAEALLDVIVVGGSLTGLMQGIVLKRLGHTVTIYEKSTSDEIISHGAGISSQEYVQEFLAKYDRYAQPHSIHCPKVQFLDKKAKVIKTWNMPLKMTSWSVLYHRLRANFDGLPSNYCRVNVSIHDITSEGRGIYRLGSRVTGIKDLGRKMALFVQQGDEKEQQIDVDLVVAADGPSSTVRQQLSPNFHRSYAGYVAWRGTVRESEVSEADRKLFADRCTFFQKGHGHILLYNIPGQDGTTESGKRLLNFVWYCNYPEDSAELRDLMTDVDGKEHRNTVPAGKVQPGIWEKQKEYAAQILPLPFVNIISKTTQPFIQRITDAPQAPKASCFGGKLLIAGDALSPFRPHIASSTNQAALNALLLEKYLKGDISLEERDAQCLDYATATSAKSVAWGTWNQHGNYDSFVAVVRCLKTLLVVWTRTRIRAWNTTSAAPMGKAKTW